MIMRVNDNVLLRLVVLGGVISTFVLGLSSYAYSQTVSPDPLEELLWLSAEALRDGDLKTAAEILDLASMTEDNPSPELRLLIDQLTQALQQQKSSLELIEKRQMQLIQTAVNRNEESRFDSLQSLEDYLQSISNAVEELAKPRSQ